MEQKKHIQSIQRAMSIIELIASEGKIKLIDIYETLGLKKTTVFGLLQTLEYEGYIEKEKNEYKLGIQAYHLGISYLKTSKINTSIHKILKKIVEQIDETAYFVMKVGNKYHYVDTVLSSQPLKVIPGEGPFVDLPGRTAVGQVYFNYKKEDFRYGCDLEKVYPNINCFSVPYIVNEKLIGFIVLTGPSNRFTKERMEETYITVNTILNNI